MTEEHTETVMPVSGVDGQPIAVASLAYGCGVNLVSRGMTIGLTKREMMAMHFCAAMMANPKLLPSETYEGDVTEFTMANEPPGLEGVMYYPPGAYARAAIAQADALLERLK